MSDSGLEFHDKVGVLWAMVDVAIANGKPSAKTVLKHNRRSDQRAAVDSGFPEAGDGWVFEKRNGGNLRRNMGDGMKRAFSGVFGMGLGFSTLHAQGEP